MTFLNRIIQLNKKIDKMKKSLNEIEYNFGQGYKYQKKQMEIEELKHLVRWYNEKIIEENDRKKHKYCLVNQCVHYIRGKCWIGKTPIDNKCDKYFLEE